MKKRTYIQPAMQMAIMPQSELMLPSSPTDGSMDTKGLAPRAATPTHPVMPLDSVSVF